MKAKPDRILKRVEAQRLLNVTPHQFVVFRQTGQLIGHLMPGFRRLLYLQSDVSALKAKIAKETSAITAP